VVNTAELGSTWTGTGLRAMTNDGGEKRRSGPVQGGWLGGGSEGEFLMLHFQIKDLNVTSKAK
jgi:hypothetical protein